MGQGGKNFRVGKLVQPQQAALGNPAIAAARHRDAGVGYVIHKKQLAGRVALNAALAFDGGGLVALAGIAVDFQRVFLPLVSELIAG